MGVSIEAILMKMSIELEKARNTSSNTSKFIQHVAKIHLLSELLLEEYEQNDITYNDMIQAEDTLTNMEKHITSSTSTEDDGTSIFDF